MARASSRGIFKNTYVRGSAGESTKTLQNFAAAAPASPWSVGLALPANRGNNSMASLAGLVYLMGGAGDTSVLSYNPSVPAWTTRTALGDPVQNGAAAAGPDGKLYLLGGYTPALGRLEDTNQFDPATNLWVFKNNAPFAAIAGIESAAAASLGSYLYYHGGIQGNGATIANLYRYDPALDIWATMTASPIARYAHGMVAHGGYLYTTGGIPTSFANSKVLNRYDPGTNTWATLAPMPAGKTGHMFVIANQIYVAGALGEANALNTSTYRYTIATDTWETLGATYNIPNHHSFSGQGAVVGSQFFVAGDVDSFSVGGPTTEFDILTIS